MFLFYLNYKIHLLCYCLCSLEKSIVLLRSNRIIILKKWCTYKMYRICNNMSNSKSIEFSNSATGNEINIPMISRFLIHLDFFSMLEYNFKYLLDHKKYSQSPSRLVFCALLLFKSLVVIHPSPVTF